MIRIQGIPVVAARLAAELKSTKTVENPTRFGQACLPVPQQPSQPAGQGRMHKSAHSGKGEKEMPQWRPDQTFYPSPKMAMQALQEAVAFVALLERPRTGPHRISGPDKFRVIVDGSRPLSSDVTLTQAVASRLMNAAAGLVPDSWWQKHFMLRAMRFTARYVLGAGKVNLAGRTPNGQEFIANPQRVWIVKSSRAVVNGVDVGPAGPLPEQPRLNKFSMPQRLRYQS
jgi:hypothetical protein